MDPWEMVPLGMVVSKESNWGVPPKHQCKHLTVTMQKPPEQAQSPWGVQSLLCSASLFKTPRLTNCLLMGRNEHLLSQKLCNLGFM